MIFKAGVATEAKACSRDTSSSTGACGRSTQPSCPSQAQSSLHSMRYDHLHNLNMFTMFFLPTVLQLHCTRCDSWQSEPHIGLCLTLLRCSLYALVAIAPISLWISVIFLHGFCSTSSRIIALFLIVLSAVVCLTHLTWSHQAQFLWYAFYWCMISLYYRSCAFKVTQYPFHYSHKFRFCFRLTSFGMESSKRSSRLAFHCMMICFRCSKSWKIDYNFNQGIIYVCICLIEGFQYSWISWAHQ